MINLFKKKKKKRISYQERIRIEVEEIEKLMYKYAKWLREEGYISSTYNCIKFLQENNLLDKEKVKRYIGRR